MLGCKLILRWQAAAARLRREGAKREADLRAAAAAAAGEATAGAQLVAALAPDRDVPVGELWRKVGALPRGASRGNTKA